MKQLIRRSKLSRHTNVYIGIAVFVFFLALFNVYKLWEFVKENSQFFTAEKLSYFVLITGFLGAMLFLRVLIALAVSKDEARKRAGEIENQLSGIVLGNLSDSVVAIDPQRVIVYANLAAQKLFEENPVGQNAADALVIKKEKGDRVNFDDTPLGRAMKTGEIVRTTVVDDGIYVEKNDGGTFPALMAATPVKDEGGTIAGAVLVLRDITRDKEIDTAKSEFVSLASHQLRTPLSMINWYADSMLAGRTGALNEEQKKYLGVIRDGNARMTALVGALLNVSRIELGTFAINPEETLLPKIADEVLLELEPQITEKKQKIAKNYDPQIKAVSADPNLVRIIFQNLLSNAVKYTSAEGEIVIAIGFEGENILITIQDTGLGIPESEQDKIFSKLFRATNARERETDGNGLGLYIVKSILDHSGGKIWFESVENKGTTFYVTIPKTGMVAREGTKKLA